MTSKDRSSQQGFTIIELLLLAVVVVILATVVALTYNGVQSKNRNATREATVDTIQASLETYYAQYNGYPSLAQLNNSTWRKDNLKSLPAGDVQDPKWSTSIKDCTVANQPAFAAQPAADCYAYQVTTTGGSACDAIKTACTQYTLTATLEGGNKYVKTSID